MGAADALDVAVARESAETFLGSTMLKTDTSTFLNFWQMSQIFHMKILEQFLDDLCVSNFGWFCSSLGWGGTLHYLQQWDLNKLASVLQDQKFTNCCEEQIFNAVVNYCRTKESKWTTKTNIFLDTSIYSSSEGECSGEEDLLPESNDVQNVCDGNSS